MNNRSIIFITFILEIYAANIDNNLSSIRIVEEIEI